jgi:ubiquinone/menaquinone biosynthesis C-methylase UbiE
MQQFDYREHFQNSAKQYDVLTRSKHISLIYELEKEIMTKILSTIDSRDKAVMDFACGTGRWTEYLEKQFKSTTGVDVSGDMLYIARNRCSKADFIHTDITSDNIDKKLIDKKYDVITAFRFYKNAQQGLREVATNAILKFLKSDGLFIFDLHLNPFSFMGLLANFLRITRLQKMFKISDLTVRTISLHQIQKLFCNTPLEIVDYYGTGILPGRGNFTILPKNMLYKIETFFMTRKILRPIAYNLLVVAKKNV